MNRAGAASEAPDPRTAERARPAPHANETRDAIVATAERLFAEQGLAAVSNRHVSEAAGQANNSAVAYHFGTRSDLVLAIVRRHTPPIERRRLQMLASLQRTADLRAWLGCLVQPVTEHLEALGSPGFYARFLAQATTDPVFRQIVLDETVATPSMQATIRGFERLLPVLPAAVHEERGEMTRYLIVHTFAERERALHEGTPTPRATWQAAAVGLVDALVGLWRAPRTPTSRRSTPRP